MASTARTACRSGPGTAAPSLHGCADRAGPHAQRPRWGLVLLSAVLLAACARSPDIGRAPTMVPSDNPAALTQSASPQPPARQAAASRVTVAPAAPVPLRRPRHALRGLASYYTAPQPTANGETFDATAMTAAHRSLPFGTRLRVTRLDTGTSVTVRINDRGPYIDGRVVDLSYAAAAKLGMVDTGLANVRLDVVHWPKPRVRNPAVQQACAASPGVLRAVCRGPASRTTQQFVARAPNALSAGSGRGRDAFALAPPLPAHR